jgi:hypothetical protein
MPCRMEGLIRRMEKMDCFKVSVVVAELGNVERWVGPGHECLVSRENQHNLELIQRKNDEYTYRFLPQIKLILEFPQVR